MKNYPNMDAYMNGSMDYLNNLYNFGMPAQYPDTMMPAMENTTKLKQKLI